MKNESCRCPCHRFNGAIIAAVGIAFLLKNQGVISGEVMNMIWPIAIIVVGLKRAFGHSLCRCCDNAKCPHD